MEVFLQQKKALEQASNIVCTFLTSPISQSALATFFFTCVSECFIKFNILQLAIIY